MSLKYEPALVPLQHCAQRLQHAFGIAGGAAGNMGAGSSLGESPQLRVRTQRKAGVGRRIVNLPWMQPRGDLMISVVSSNTNATRIGWHLWAIDLRFAPGLPPGWIGRRIVNGLAVEDAPASRTEAVKMFDQQEA